MPNVSTPDRNFNGHASTKHHCVGTGIPRAFFARELAALCKLALEEAPVQALDAVYQGGEVDFVRQIAGFVTERATALLKMAADIPKFKKDSF